MDRIQKLREQMKLQNIAAYIIPSTDAHQSEYLPDVWKRRAYISGFDGSAGDVVITLDKGGLWTDGRYYAQATEQLAGSGIDLYKTGEKDTDTIAAFLNKILNPGNFVGVDPKTFSMEQMHILKKDLNQIGLKLKVLETNLVDIIWQDQPPLPLAPIKVHTLKFAGESVERKLTRLRDVMQENNVDAHIITMLDAIAWLFNLRGKDVSFNPVFISYAIVTQENAQLFALQEKFSDEVRQHLGTTVELHDYSLFKEKAGMLNKAEVKIWLDGATTNYWLASLLDNGVIFNAASPVIKFKAIKNQAELKGFRDCHIRDGVAMVNYLYWLEQTIEKGDVSEKSSAEKLEFFREKQDMYQGPSFNTISSYKIHGAIIHYSVTEESDISLEQEGIYLIDSGGQYLDGTTDITRTIALGEPTASERDTFTRVLMGHINLSMISFPKGTTGPALDTISRLPLWEAGLNFNHGTGHGVGSYLGVHEGPQSINPAKAFSVPLEIGMICSNEPGYYKEKQYGMRIENLITVVRDDKKSNDEFEFYKFEDATCCPIDTRLINDEIMSSNQIQWLNDYHKKVWKELSPFLDGDVKSWLRKVTAPI